LPGAEKVNDYGQLQELRIAPDTDPQRILRDIMNRTEVLRFDVVKPSLHDIFIRIAGPESKEEEHA